MHPKGGELKTPLLVRSFSSKGFKYALNRETRRVESELEVILNKTKENMLDSILLSAYDIKHFIPTKNDLWKELNPSFLFIDSGGYETSDGYDFSEAYQHPVYRNKKIKWDRSEHIKVLNSIPERFSTILVSYDNGNEKRKSIAKQIESSKLLFQNYPLSLHDFLIKSERANEDINIDSILDNISLFKSFHIIGLTEKELGPSIVERMVNIRKVREALNSVGNNAPVHIFGSLDPVTSILYFLAGAEIFDGLTWLRFAFYEDMCLYRENYNVIHQRFNEPDNLNSYSSYLDNSRYLTNLQRRMKSFLSEFTSLGEEHAFTSFLPKNDYIKSCYKQFKSI